MENWVKRFREIPMVKLLRESECVAHNDEDQDLANIMTEVNKHEWDKIEDFISQELDKAREEGVKVGMENAWGMVSALLDTLDVDKNEEEIRILTGINQLFDKEITRLALKLKE